MLVSISFSELSPAPDECVVLSVLCNKSNYNSLLKNFCELHVSGC